MPGTTKRHVGATTETVSLDLRYSTPSAENNAALIALTTAA